MARCHAVLALSLASGVSAFVVPSFSTRAPDVSTRARAVADMAESREKFWIEFEIPKKGIAEYGTCQAKLAPLMDSSECVTIETPLPLGLSAEPQDGRVVVTQGGAGGERAGDVLRFFSAWKIGPDGGPIAQPDMVDVDKMMWRTMANGERVARSQSEGFDKVVAALCSNDGSYGTSIVMVFERPTA